MPEYNVIRLFFNNNDVPPIIRSTFWGVRHSIVFSINFGIHHNVSTLLK